MNYTDALCPNCGRIHVGVGYGFGDLASKAQEYAEDNVPTKQVGDVTDRAGQLSKEALAEGEKAVQAVKEARETASDAKVAAVTIGVGAAGAGVGYAAARYAVGAKTATSRGAGAGVGLVAGALLGYLLSKDD